MDTSAEDCGITSCLLLAVVALTALVLFQTGSLTPGLGLPPTTHDAQASSSERPGCKRLGFQNSSAVYLDDVCYPPTKRVNLVDVVHDGFSLDKISIEPFRTQFWSSPDFDRLDTHINIGMTIGTKLTLRDYASVKTFTNAIVYCAPGTTYLQNKYIWTASERCVDAAIIVPTKRPWYRLPTNYIDEAVVVASQAWGGAIYHQLSERAYGIAVARDILERNPRSIIIVHPDGYLVEQFVELLGISRSRLWVMNNDQAVLVERAHLTYLLRCFAIGATTSVLARQWIRDRHAYLYDSAISKDAKNILILDRSERGCQRCLLNTIDMIAEARRAFPDREVCSWKATLKEQMMAFATSGLVVAPHGAGLANLVYMPFHGKVIEVQNKPQEYHTAFISLSQGLGLSHRAISPLRINATFVNFSMFDIPKTLDTMRKMLAGYTFNKSV